MGNDIIILFNGLLKEFSWHRAVIIYTMEIKGNQISWNLMVHSGHCLTHENNRDSHFMDHENDVKGHEITKKIFMDH